MFNQLSEKEIGTTYRFVRHGLSKAALSLERILNSRVELESIYFPRRKINGFSSYCSKKGKETHLIKTLILGELAGTCHFIVSKEEVEKMQNKCLPSAILSGDTAENKMMKLEFITEIANIVVASVITELANYLNVKSHGHVPALHIMNNKEVHQYIHAESVVMDYDVQFRTTFYVEELDVEPEFIWLFQNDFIDELKEFANRKSALELP